MKKPVLILCIVLSYIFISHAAFSSEKGSWYIGFGLGSGQGWIKTKHADNTFEDAIEKVGDANNLNFNNPSLPLALNIGLGGIINSKHHLGIELSGIMQSDSDNAVTYTIRANNIFLTTLYFPFEQGLSFKIGGGYSRFNEDIFGSYYNAEHTSHGYGGLVGIGYDFNFGSSFNLGLHVDYTYQHYNDKELENIRFVSCYISFYWF